MTSILGEMEDNLKLWQMEYDLNFFKNGRQPNFCCRKMEDDLNVLENGIRPQSLANGRPP